jgi:hypothetical protein
MLGTDLYKLYRENREFVVAGICVIIAIYIISVGVYQFAFLFPEGQYQYAASVFFAGVVLSCGLILYRPVVALALLILILPLGVRLAEYLTIELGDLIFTVDVIAIWMITLIYIFIHGLRGDRLLVYFSSLLIILTISSFVNLSAESFGIMLCGVVSPCAIYILTRNIVRKDRDFKLIILILALISILCSLFAFVQPIINDKISDFVYLRLVSVFYNPIIFANAMLLLWPYVLIADPFDVNKFQKINNAFKTIGVFISLTALFFAGSRGADVICGIQILWILKKKYSDRKVNLQHYRFQFFVVAIGIVFLMSLYSEFLTETIFRRFFQSNSFDEGSSASERILGAMGAMEIGLSNLLIGVGLGGFKIAYLTTHAASIGELDLESAHNFILNLFAEGGLVALVIWLLMLFCIYRRLDATKFWFESINNLFTYRALQASIFGYTASQFLFYGEFLHKNVGLPMILYFIVFGLISAVYFMKKARFING